MIYQLAKTSPLLTGQVKMNMIMNGSTVSELQYTPISNHISFNYANSDDVLNYSHGENIKRLYEKIPDNFFSNVINPELSVSTLHRYNVFYDDTHENTYEMGMKRCEYQRYNKQFEFFCPFWCDDINEFNQIKFVLNVTNYKGDILLKKQIDFSKKIKQYIKQIFSSLVTDTTQKNTDLLYIDFEKQESFIKGINVKTGLVQTKDVSYIISDLLSTQKPVIETDNSIVNLFNQNNIVCTQLFNFNFVFDLFEIIPLSFLKDMTLKNFNVYIDMYTNNTKVDVKDIYSNYDFISKYDIYTGQNSEENVLDYMSDNTVNVLCDKNKLAQSVFHWALYDNQQIIFNLYDGFSPINSNAKYYYLSTDNADELKNCSLINSESPNILSTGFNENDNPFGMFKYANFSDKTDLFTLLNDYLSNDDNYFSVNLTDNTLKEKSYQFFGNILLDNSKILSFKQQYIKEQNTHDEKIKKQETKESKLKYAFLLKNINDNKISNVNCYKLSDIKTVKCAICELNNTLSDSLLTNVLGKNYLITPFINMSDTENKSQNDFIAVRETADALYIIIFFKRLNRLVDNYFSDFFNFENLYTKDFQLSNLFENKNTNAYFETKTEIIYNAINLVSSLLKCTKFPGVVSFSRSYTAEKEQNTLLNCNTTYLAQTMEYVDLYRYSNKLVPCFIDLDDENKYNNIYWVKQYNKNIIENKKTEDIDCISDFVNYQNTKLSPIYPEVDYYTLKKLDRIDYDVFYLDDYDKQHTNTWDKKQNKQYEYYKEKSWYKNNYFLLLPAQFESVISLPSGKSITESNILNCIYSYFEKYIFKANINRIKRLLLLYIKNLYSYDFTYDYEENIKTQKYTIKFTLK